MTTTTAELPFTPLPGGGDAPERHPLSRDIRAGAYPVTPRVFRNLIAAEDRLTLELERSRTETAEPFTDWLSVAATRLAAGEDLPGDLVAEAETRIQAQETRRVAELAITHLRRRINSQWRQALTEHIDDMLIGLREELDETLTAVRSAASAVDNLDLTDPEAVNEATPTQRTALTQLKELRPRYRRLRHLQEELLRRRAENPPLATGHRTWTGLFRSRIHEFYDIAHNGMPAEDLPAVAWFRRLTHRDDVWLPTWTELIDNLTPRTAEPARRHGTDVPASGYLTPATVAALDARTHNNGGL